MKQILFILIFLFPIFIFSQSCDCKTNFEWTKKTFEENDAGFQYIIDKKGKQAYAVHNTLTSEKVSKISNLEDCMKELREWQHFFRFGHIGIARMGKKKDEIGENKVNRQFYEVDVEKFKKYLGNKGKLGIEGIWKLDGYEIAIQEANGKYMGSILKSENESWKLGEVKFSFDKENNGVYYMRDKSEFEINKVKLLEDNLLKINSYFLERVFPTKAKNENISNFMKAISATEAYAYKYDENTFYLRIPSFHHSQEKQIDSLILAHKDEFLKTPNLIIDIRGNGGGSDVSYEDIRPFFYTNPIRKVGVEFLSTKSNNQRMLDIIDGAFGELSEEKKEECRRNYEKLSNNLGSFVNLGTKKFRFDSLETIHTFPKNIGVLIDENIASTGEEFILEAKQSNKVKVFGRTTMGALDVSNQYYLPSPCEEFVMIYTLSKSFRVPEMMVDDIGVQPDIYLDESTPEFEWIEYVLRYFE